MNWSRKSFAGVLLAALLGGCSGSGGEDSRAREHAVAVAAAADLRFAFDDVATAFQKRQPDIHVEVTYGSSGNFLAQLQQRAPFDLFLSADTDYPRRLIDAGLAEEDTFFVYGRGHLVLYVRNDSPLDLARQGMQALVDPSVHHIAIANPRFAPYGRVAEAALKTFSLYDRVQDRLVLGENVGQAAHFVLSGGAEIGLISLAQAMSPTLREQGRYWLVPANAYPRLEQGGVTLSWARDRFAAEALREFVLKGEGKDILRQYGFSDNLAVPEKD